VLIAAISSAISLMEVLVTFFLDRAQLHGRTGNRNRITLWVSLAILVEAMVVAIDGLGSNGLWVPGQSLGIAGWNDCWLDFMDCWSEGIMMPLGAMLMALMIGWELHPKSMLEEINHGLDGNPAGLDAFYTVCIRFIAPIAMAFILAGQIDSFFGGKPVVPAVQWLTWGYLIGFVSLVVFWIVALTGSKSAKK
jgi:NSS family neurotransmitter:Na+ symporter